MPLPYGRLLHPWPALTNCKSCRMQHWELPQDAHKTQTYNICMTKHSPFPYTSTYSSTPRNTNSKHNTHHIHYTNTQHTSTRPSLFWRPYITFTWITSYLYWNLLFSSVSFQWTLYLILLCFTRYRQLLIVQHIISVKYVNTLTFFIYIQNRHLCIVLTAYTPPSFLVTWTVNYALITILTYVYLIDV